MRMMFLSYPADAESAAARVLEDWETLDWMVLNTANDRTDVRLILPETDSQALVDALQSALGPFENWRLDILPVEASIGPETPEADEKEAEADTEEKTKQNPETALREEIYEDVASGAALNQTFLILTVLSAIVAALGMNANSVAVVIGAMVIAPRWCSIIWV